MILYDCLERLLYYYYACMFLVNTLILLFIIKQCFKGRLIRNHNKKIRAQCWHWCLYEIPLVDATAVLHCPTLYRCFYNGGYLVT